MRKRNPIYDLKAWKTLRDVKLTESPLCEECARKGRHKPAQEVDHIIPISEGGLVWHEANLQSLCKSCHRRKTLGETFPRREYVGGCGLDGWPTDPRHPANGGTGKVSAEVRARVMPSLERSKIPLTIVCGPPGCGKSTYVRDNAGPEDLVIDLDRIMSDLSGMPEHHTAPMYLDQALIIRNELLASLADEPPWPAAWFIVSAPDSADRRRWLEMLGGRMVIVATPLQDCIKRIDTDPLRDGMQERMARNARDWWAANEYLSTKRAQVVHLVGFDC